ncbi:MAG: zinc ABC transporter substrate-binding protein [Planctomycetes bacterium]|nr:zinc ABC transporter substrate-binding protein [Planctomycetota bacterium]
MNRRKITVVAIMAVLAGGIVSGCKARQADQPDGRTARLKIVCTTFPIWLLTRNVVGGQADVSVDALLPPQTGCPHDYSLKPQDMQRLAGADILIVNGLGMEDFLGRPVKNANPDLKIIDSSQGITDLIELKDAGRDEREHHHSGMNPHLFASPRQAARLVRNIAGQLSKFDPAGAKAYQTNAAGYAAQLDSLADEFSAAVKQLKSGRIVTQHAVFDYLARDAGLTISAVLEEEPGQAPSAAQMIELVKQIRSSGAAAIFIEPQYSDNVGQTVARETSLPAAALDPAASGPENATLDYYQTAMRKNIEVLRQTIGSK